MLIVAPATAAAAAATALDGSAPGLWDAVFYTLGLSGIAFYIITMAVLRQFQWLTYAAYGLLLLLLWASLDGTLTWAVNGSSRFADLSPLIIGAVTGCFGFLHAAWRIEPPHGFAKLRWPFVGFALITAALIPALWVTGSLVPLYAVLNTCMLLMVTAQVIPPITWNHLPPRVHASAVVGPIALAVAAVGFYAVHFLGPGFSRAQLDLGNRLLFLIHITQILSLALIHVIDEARAHQQALRTAADAARETAETALALERANQQYDRARRIAGAHARQLAEASHDIRQPISALRSAFHQLPGQDPEPVNQAIDYLDELASRYLTISHGALPGAAGNTEGEPDEVERDSEGRERVSAMLLTDTIGQMFAAEAQQKGIALRARATANMVHAQPLAVTRILSNLVANAIAHSSASRVLLSGRRRGDHVLFEVRDNGTGMTETELSRLQERHARGEDSDGAGLGLAIVRRLAEEQDLAFTIRSLPDRGTCAGIRVPLVV